MFTQAGKHVSQIAVGGPAPPKKQSLPSASAFGGDERHFNLAVINGEDTEVKKPVNGGHIEQELGPEFGKATLSKSAPVADVVVGPYMYIICNIFLQSEPYEIIHIMLRGILLDIFFRTENTCRAHYIADWHIVIISTLFST